MAISMEKIRKQMEIIDTKQSNGYIGPCPRCNGKLKSPINANALSKHNTLYICRMCAHEESTGPNPIPITSWAFALTLQETPRNKLNNSECEGGGCQA